MQEMTTRTKRMRRSPRPRLRVGRLIFVLLLILAGIGWRYRPIVPPLVARIPAWSAQCWVRGAGFLLPADDTYFTSLPCTVDYWKWYGNKAWAIKLPAADPADWPGAKEWNGREFSASMHGTVAAVACAGRAAITIMTWQDGRQRGRFVLPITRRERFRIQALDDGRVLFWQTSALASPLLLIDGDHLAGKAMHRTALTMEPSVTYERSVSPNGVLLLGRKIPTVKGRLVNTPEVECARVEVTGQRMNVYPYFTIPHMKNPHLFNDAIVGHTGATYSQRDLEGPDGWLIAPDIEPYPDSAVQYKRRMVRVLLPDSREAWRIPRPQPTWSVAITPNGRYALAFDSHIHPFNRSLAGLTGRFPGLHDTVSLLCTPRRLMLYRQPGTNFQPMTLMGNNYSIRQAFLSPGAHRLLMLAENADSGRKEFLLYRMPAGVEKALGKK